MVAYLGLDGDVERGSRRLRTQRRWAERAREMQEGVVFGHGACVERRRWGRAGESRESCRC